MRARQKGFTLIELVAGIVLFAIIMTLFITLIVPQAAQSARPVLQVQATELAKSLMNEINARSYDDFSDRSGGAVRCNEDLNGDGDLNDVGERACTPQSDFGPEPGETRATFDDVDDYHGLTESGAAISNSLGNQITADGVSVYADFSVQVTVIYAGNFYDASANVQDAKLISVRVTAPEGTDITFTSIRSNY